MRYGMLVFAVFVTLLLVAPAQSEVVVWESTEPFVIEYSHWSTMAYFDQELHGVTEVRAQIVGSNGAVPYSCWESGESGLASWVLVIEADNGSARINPDAYAEFDEDIELVLVDGADGWEYLDDGYAFIMIIPIPNMEGLTPDCTPISSQSTPPTIESLTLTITYETTVSTEPSTWGRVRSLYR